MSEGHIAAINKTNKRKNRRKKRRTQDVSDSSSSDSSSDSENSSVEDNDTKLENVEKAASDVEDVVLSDVDMDKEDDEAALDDKKASRKEGSILSAETVDRLNKVGLTTSDLTGNNGIHLGNIDLNKMSATLDESSSKLLEHNKDKNGLKNQYLSMLFESYGDDMNELRNAPDFTSKTLVMLANVLKDGGDMFDLETLKTIVEDK